VLVHGSAIVARESGADGVHLPERASVAAARSIVGAGALVGASRHDAEGVREAALAAADYTTLSPVFASPGKGKPLGLALFAEVARSSGLPVVALGGIVGENAAACRAAGAAAVAAIRGVWEGDVARNVRSLL
jgi:thiamine-phosphate pyrophosphorylase